MEPETREVRLRRLAMRSQRRGIKEMDLILGGFATQGLDDLSPDLLECYEALLSENDHDLYFWVSKGENVPEDYRALIAVLRDSLDLQGISLKS